MKKITMNSPSSVPFGTPEIGESRILDVPIANMDYRETVERIMEWGRNREHRYICVCNVHSTTSSAWMPKLRNALLRSDFNTADGVPLVWAQKLLGYGGATRVYGPTLMLHTLEKACEEGLRIAFYGGHPGRLAILMRNLRERFPKIKIVESISPPFHSLSDEEDGYYTRRLLESRADIIWVGLGCPKQEEWMLEHSSIIPGVMIGVGAAFDFHAGAVLQAPPVLQRAGLEWAYRLYREPRRLFMRYVTTNPIFMLKILAQFAGRMVSGKFANADKARYVES